MEDVTLDDVMKAFAEDAVRLARGHGIVLDFSEPSLEQVDLILYDLARDGVITPQTPQEDEALWLTSQILGGYVGEVVIRTMGGAWETLDHDDGTAEVRLVHEGIVMVPLTTVYRRLTEDQFKPVARYCSTLRAILERRADDAG
jgi:hypothetical protein